MSDQQPPPPWRGPEQPQWQGLPPAPVDPALARWGEGWAPPPRLSTRRIAAVVAVAAVVLLVVPIACAVWLGASLGNFIGTPVLHLEVGQCFNGGVRPGATSESYVFAVDVVECGVPHDGELIAAFDYPAAGGAAFPGVNELGSFGERECSVRFAAYVGLPIERSTLFLTSLYPTPQGWRVGDRSIQCVVQPPLGQETSTGTVRDTRR